MPDIDRQYKPNTPLPPDGRPGRRRRVLNQERVRQERRRDRMKESGIPETHRVNSALSEGLSFALAARLRAGPLSPELQQFANTVLIAAMRVLVERKRCDPAAAEAAVLKQMRRRPMHDVAGSILCLPPRRRA